MSPIDPDAGEVQDPYQANAALLYDMWIDVYKKCLRIVEEYINKWEAIASVHEAHFSLPLPYTTIPPGPINLSGKDMKILAANAISDGTVDVTATAITFSGPGETTVDHSMAPVLWTAGSRLGISSISGGDDGTYLAFTWSIIN